VAKPRTLFAQFPKLLGRDIAVNCPGKVKHTARYLKEFFDKNIMVKNNNECFLCDLNLEIKNKD